NSNSTNLGQANEPIDNALNFTSEPEFKFAGNPTDRFLFVLAWAFRKQPDAFDRACREIRGTHRVYFARSADDIERAGTSTKPKRIPGTPYWALTTLSTNAKNELLTKVLCDILRYDREAVLIALNA